jgi:hypothetical protein
MRVRLIGYWQGGGEKDDGRWPDPRDLIDESWSNQERELVASYLEHGFKPFAFLGFSGCRLCGRLNGSAEFTDGVYLWPEGLARYVREHSVRLPPEVLAHIGRRYEELGSFDADRDWSAEYPDRAFLPEGAAEQFAYLVPGWDGVETLFVDRDWWPEVTSA